MFLQNKQTGDIVEVLTQDCLYNPCKLEITGRSHLGEEMQEPEIFLKSELVFPSGEDLPRCWLDAHYRETDIRRITLAVGV